MSSYTDDMNLELPSEGVQYTGQTINANFQKINDGRTHKGTLGEPVSDYLLVYINPDDGKLWKARANTISASRAIGFVTEEGIANEERYVKRNGYITNSAWSFTPGSPIYLSATDYGGVVESATVATAGPNSTFVGWAYDATTIWIWLDWLSETITSQRIADGGWIGVTSANERIVFDGTGNKINIYGTSALAASFTDDGIVMPPGNFIRGDPSAGAIVFQTVDGDPGDSYQSRMTINYIGASVDIDFHHNSLDDVLSLLIDDGGSIQTGTTTGMMVGGAAAQKIDFFGKTPRVQCAKASFNNWAAFGDVVNALVSLGLFDAA